MLVVPQQCRSFVAGARNLRPFTCSWGPCERLFRLQQASETPFPQLGHDLLTSTVGRLGRTTWLFDRVTSSSIGLELGSTLRQVLKKMQHQVPKADVDAVVQCKPGAIEQVKQWYRRPLGMLTPPTRSIDFMEGPR